MALVINTAVIEECSDASALLDPTLVANERYDSRNAWATHSASVCIHHEHQSVKVASGIKTRRANRRFSVLYIPKLQVATTPLRASGSEFKLCRPFGML